MSRGERGEGMQDRYEEGKTREEYRCYREKGTKKPRGGTKQGNVRGEMRGTGVKGGKSQLTEGKNAKTREN